MGNFHLEMFDMFGKAEEYLTVKASVSWFQNVQLDTSISHFVGQQKFKEELFAVGIDSYTSDNRYAPICQAGERPHMKK